MAADDHYFGHLPLRANSLRRGALVPHFAGKRVSRRVGHMAGASAADLVNGAIRVGVVTEPRIRVAPPMTDDAGDLAFRTRAILGDQCDELALTCSAASSSRGMSISLGTTPPSARNGSVPASR